MTKYENGPVGGFVGYVEHEDYVDFIDIDGVAHRWDRATDMVTLLSSP